MKLLFIISLLFISLNARNYTYLIDEYDKVIDLEAKIITKIAKDILKTKKVNIFIPHEKSLDKKVYSSKVTLVNNCKDANFIFTKYEEDDTLCKGYKNKYFFTDNYKKLILDKKYIGAFFWSKSRPNVILIKNRLIKRKIKLSKEYNHFIEEYNEK